MKSFQLGNGHLVDGIEIKGAYYIVHGQNNAGAHRSIQVHADGSLKNFQGGDIITGYVDGQMKSQLADIFKHFDIPLPTASASAAQYNALSLKKTITLSGGTEYDQRGNNLSHYFSYRASISNHARFWEKPPVARTQDLNAAMRIVSEDLMEQDYSEVQSGGHSGNVSYQGKIAYHQNHGTAHGLRQREYQTQYLELVKNQGTPAFKTAAENLTSEELEIMKLSAYMHRLGRTNESGFQGDKLYGPRSMQIFSQVALDLGFDPKLVRFVSGTMNKFRSANELQQQNDGDAQADPDFSSFRDIPEGCAREKAILFERLIEAGHQTDLVRCWGSQKYIGVRDNLAQRLDGMLQPSCDTKQISSEFLGMAGALCRATGAPVRMLHKSANLNASLVVQSANNVAETKDRLALTANDYAQKSILLDEPTFADTGAKVSPPFATPMAKTNVNGVGNPGKCDPVLVQVEKILNAFKVKIDSLDNPSCSAVKQALDLHQTLTNYTSEYAKNKLGDPLQAANTFKEKSTQAITDAIPALDKGLGLGPWLLNLVKQLTNAIIMQPASFIGIKAGFFKVAQSEHTKAAEEMQVKIGCISNG